MTIKTLDQHIEMSLDIDGENPVSQAIVLLCAILSCGMNGWGKVSMKLPATMA